jgi:hypothetical protein
MTELQLKIWHRLSTRSRRSITKVRGKNGRIHQYRPKGDLLNALSVEFDLSPEDAYAELAKIRRYWLAQV